MYNLINNCRICGNNELEMVFNLGEQELTGSFPKSIDESVTKGPIELVQCKSENGCGLVQLKQSYDINEMYGLNYGYRSGLNKSMVEHLHSKIDAIVQMKILEDEDVIIDIGSNDATSLLRYPQEKYKLIGVDPTGKKFSSYYPSNITLIDDFFSMNIIGDTLKGKKAKVITSFSMFYDLEDPVSFAKDIEETLDQEGIWITEQSYLPFMITSNSFDTICHEHLDFYSLKQIIHIAEMSRLRVIDVEFNEVNGGSFSIILCKENASYITNKEKIDQVLLNETEMGLDTGKAFIDFRKGVQIARDSLVNFLIDAKNNNQNVSGIGASTKGNVLLQYFGITTDFINNIGEVNEDKFGTYTPGTLIPIIPEHEVLDSYPDYLLILPWHFKNFFINNPKFKGRSLVLPLPEFEIIKV